jgi:ABC-type Fe3+/spermidine/putrescine transport system ATPase subunit
VAETVLSIRGLRRSFGDLVVLHDVSLAVAAGQICAVVGPNGSGKTTLLRCVAGTLRPDAGEVLLLGRALEESDPRTRAAVASVLDDVDFFPDLSVAEHLELMAWAPRHAGRAGRRRAHRDRVGLDAVGTWPSRWALRQGRRPGPGSSCPCWSWWWRPKRGAWRPDGARWRSAILVGSVVLVAAAVVLGSRRPELAPPRVPVTMVAVVGLAVAGRSLVRARRALSRVDRTTLAGGAQIARAAMSAAIMLGPSFISEIIAARRWRAVGRVYSRHWRPAARSVVLLQADLRRQWRRRPDLFAWAALALAPYCVAAFAPGAVASARIVAAYIAVDRLAGGLRTVSRSPALRRSLGGSDRALRWIHLVVPAAGLAVWWAGTLPAGAVHEPAVNAVLTVGVLAAVYRTATRKPILYDGGLAHTPIGPIPVTLLRQILRGPDLVAILVLVGLILPVTTGSR